MPPQDYEYLLVPANLAHFYQTWGFSIKKLKWKLFLEGDQFSASNCTCTFEIDSKKLDLNAHINGDVITLLPSMVDGECRQNATA
jgi:hypothetical protein